MYDHLVSESKIRGLNLKNRVVFPAMGSRFCSDDGYLSDQGIDYYTARAKGGCGLIVTEAVAVWKPGSVFRMLQISDDSYIAQLKKLTESIHAAGGKACIQLWQGGLATSQTPGSVIVMPSDLPLGEGKVLPGASKETIHEIVKAFGEAAKRAVEAGFDCVEFHAAHNYSPHSFLSPAFNRRDDEYGGSLENRARYSIESIREIRKNIPEDMPIFMRVPAKDDELPVGLSIEDVIEFCKMAKAAGVDVLDVSRGNIVTSAMRYEVPPLDIPRGFNVDNAATIRKAAKMPTIAVGRINNADLAESIIAEDKADMVVMGRAQIADPNFCNKAKAGNVEDILNCIGCNQGCYENCLIGAPITCLRNPSVGKEAEFAALKKVSDPKKVLVIGGGVGGMEAAMMAHMLGHDVTLAEASDKLGGQFLLAGKAPRKQEIEAATIKREKQLQRAGVKIEYNTVVDKAYLESFAPEVVIAAVGASPLIPDIEGVKGNNVYNFIDVLNGTKTVEGHVVVAGGGLVGLEVAEYIREKGNEVTVIEMQDSVAKDVGAGRKTDILIHVAVSGIKTVTDSKCVKITSNSVVVDQKGEIKEIPCDSVVLAVGSKSNPTSWIEEYCQKHAVEYKVVGDAVNPRRAIQAIHEGVEAAINI